MPCAYFEGKDREMKAKKEREGLLFQRMNLRSLWSLVTNSASKVWNFLGFYQIFKPKGSLLKVNW
jgi:hypothetical protein